MTIDPETLNARIGAAIRRERERRDWTQTDLAEAMGKVLGSPMNRVVLGRVEAGTRPLTLPELQAVDIVLGISPGELLAGRRTPPAIKYLARAVDQALIDEARATRTLRDAELRGYNAARGREALVRLLAVKEGVDTSEQSRQSVAQDVAVALIALEEAGMPLPELGVLEALGIPDAGYHLRQGSVDPERLAEFISEHLGG